MSTRTTRQSSRAAGSAQGPSALKLDKENVETTTTAVKTKPTKKNAPTFCLCHEPDDGSPMIHCSSCDDWYHFRCVELSEQDAMDIRLYACRSCQENSGARIIREWEEAEAPQDLVGEGEGTDGSRFAGQAEATEPRTESTTEFNLKAEEQHDSGASSDGSDEYDPKLDEQPKRRAQRPSNHSDGESDSDGPRAKSPKRLRRAGSSLSKEPTQTKKQQQPPPSSVASSQAKRKKASSSHPPPPPKRPRSESTTGEDAARKYCLIKLQELFCQIFMRYPFLHQETEEQDEAAEGLAGPTKKTEELTQEEKEQLDARAKQFGIDLEQCMYELYSELDKQGKPVVAGKYKERFRMLTFNLSKADRVVLHMRIASSRISPKELSTMSSTDLASEEEKQSIKKLEEEALAHSILTKSMVPRAKLTHKGLQDIEDVTGAAQRDAEREREAEEREGIERERLARLRLQAQRTQSQGSAPPESPVVAQTPTWGAPPPVPLHAADPSSSASRPPVHPLFMPSSSDSFLGSADIELNLTDLINIDEEPSGEVAMTPIDAMPTPFGENPPLLLESKAFERASQPTPSPITPTHAAGISPFAANVPSRSSFDLNALWTPSEAEPYPTKEQERSETANEGQPVEADPLGSGAGAEDQDFDMFLNNNDQDQDQDVVEDRPPTPEPVELSPEEKRAAFDAQPTVWNGTLSMPLDSAIPQEVAVVARQTGGRILGTDSPLWQTLFPIRELRIDGRVPVEKSAQYLTQVRLNPSKELIAVAFSPTPGFEPAGFHALKSHLLSKGRHGLVFPWGHNPKASAPGRELYIVPLLASEPVPEYMELFDNLQLPPQRIADYFVGVWVLTKGKLVPPPQPVPAPVPTPPAASIPPAAAPPPLPNIDFAQLSQLQQLIPPQLPSHSPSPHSLLQTRSPVGGAAPALPPTIPNVAPVPNVTAEIASLTPEQIQLMLKTLTKTTQAQAAPSAQAPIPGAMPSYHPIPPSYPHAPPPQPITLPTAALQAWGGQPEQYPSAYPSQPPPPPPPPPSHPHPHGYPGPGGHTPPRGGFNDGYHRDNDGYHRDRDRPFNNNNSGYEYDRGYRGRGGRGGRGDRGRGQNWQKGASRSRGGPPTGPRHRGNSGWGGDQQQRWN